MTTAVDHEKAQVVFVECRRLLAEMPQGAARFSGRRGEADGSREEAMRGRHSAGPARPAEARRRAR